MPALQYIGGAVGGASVSLSGISWQPGDICLVAHCRQNGSGGDPTMPAGWVDLGFPPAYTLNYRLRNGYRILQTGDTATGTSTNATDSGIVVYRDQDASTPIGADNGGLYGTSATITYEDLTLQTAGGWAVLFGWSRAVAAVMETVPAGATLRQHRVGTGELAIFDTNGHVASWPDTNVNVTDATGFKCTRSLEVRSAGAGAAAKLYVAVVA